MNSTLNMGKLINWRISPITTLLIFSYCHLNLVEVLHGKKKKGIDDERIESILLKNLEFRGKKRIQHLIKYCKIALKYLIDII